jgi:hypothetical protein
VRKDLAECRNWRTDSQISAIPVPPAWLPDPAFVGGKVPELLEGALVLQRVEVAVG